MELEGQSSIEMAAVPNPVSTGFGTLLMATHPARNRPSTHTQLNILVFMAYPFEETEGHKSSEGEIHHGHSKSPSLMDMHRKAPSVHPSIATV